MRKRMLVLAMLLCAILPLAGCSAKTAPDAVAATAPEFKPCAEIAATLTELEAMDFEELTELSRKGAVDFLALSDALIVDLALWMDASRATTETVLVLTATDADALLALQAQVEAYRDTLTEEYRDYVPEELPKLESALLETHDMQLAFIICKDAAVAQASLGAAW